MCTNTLYGRLVKTKSGCSASATEKSQMDMDSDNDNNDDNDNETDLTGFLFGNIDSDGRLIDDIFDSESKKQLSSLARFVRDRIKI